MHADIERGYATATYIGTVRPPAHGFGELWDALGCPSSFKVAAHRHANVWTLIVYTRPLSDIGADLNTVRSLAR